MRGVLMKEKTEKIKEWIKKNKKRTIGIAVAVVLLIGALGIGIAGVNGFGSNAAQPDKTVASVKDKSANQKKTDKNTKTKNDTDAAEEKVEETKEQDDKDKAADNKESASSKNEQTNTSAGSSNTKAASTSNSSSSTSTASKPAHTHSYTIPIYSSKQVYVVDKAAWTETVEEPVYETVERSICNGCGADITGNEGAHMKENMLAGNTACGGYHSEVKQVQTGTDTYTINHPEEGHYETESYVSGYKCSCGATK